MEKVLFFLTELSNDDVDWLVHVGEKKEIPTGTVLIYEGRAVDTLYIMLEGTLVVSTAAMGGKELARLSSGEIVGEMSFVDARPPSATVRTLEDSVVLAIARPKLADKLQEDVGFSSRFYRALAILLSNRLRGTVKQLGYSPSASGTEGNPDGTEMDESVAIAKTRFQNFLERLKGM